jgi:hypothetical protein
MGNTEGLLQTDSRGAAVKEIRWTGYRFPTAFRRFFPLLRQKQRLLDRVLHHPTIRQEISERGLLKTTYYLLHVSPQLFKLSSLGPLSVFLMYVLSSLDAEIKITMLNCSFLFSGSGHNSSKQPELGRPLECYFLISVCTV